VSAIWSLFLDFDVILAVNSNRGMLLFTAK